MRRKIIALDTSRSPWQLAVTSGTRGEPVIDQLAELEYDPGRALADQLEEALGMPLDSGDRLAVCLPAGRSMVRWLSFPFQDARKIAAATPQELAHQLPRDLDTCQVRQVRLTPRGAETNVILAAAVPDELLQEILAQFDDQREPLGFIGLAPFAWHEGLPEETGDGLLVAVSGDEICLGLRLEGMLRDLRVRPRLPGQKSIDLIEFILRQGRILLGSCGGTRRAILLGEEANSELAQALAAAGMEVEVPNFSCAGQPVTANQAPVAALALGAARHGAAGLNFRSGELALKNEWQAVRKRLLAAGALLAATLLLTGAGAWLHYHQRSEHLNQLKQAMRQRYRQAFPAENAIVDVALQLQVKLRELQAKQSHLGSGNGSALRVLQEVSARCPEKLKLDIREYSYSPSGLRLAGTTESFDAVTRIARSLKASPLFSEVKISDTKQQQSDEKVQFRLQLSFSSGGAS